MGTVQCYSTHQKRHVGHVRAFSYVCHASVICVAWLLHMCGIVFFFKWKSHERSIVWVASVGASNDGRFRVLQRVLQCVLQCALRCGLLCVLYVGCSSYRCGHPKEMTVDSESESGFPESCSPVPSVLQFVAVCCSECEFGFPESCSLVLSVCDMPLESFVCDMIRAYLWHDVLWCNVTYSCVVWRTSITYSYVCRTSITYSYVWRTSVTYSYVCVCAVTHARRSGHTTITHSYHDAFTYHQRIRVPWRIHG